MSVRRIVAAVVAGALVMGPAGCGVNAEGATQTALRAQAVAATTTTTTLAGPAPAPVNCGDPTPSLRPQGPQPAAGGPMPAGSYMATIAQRGRLVVGVDQNTLLFGYLNTKDQNQIEGFDIDILRQVAKAIFGDDHQNENTHLQFKAISSAQRIPFVQNGSVDIVAETMTITCARTQLVSFSSVYYDAGQKVMVRTDSPIASSADLGGKRVCAAAGSTSIANVTDTTKTHAKAPAVPVPVVDWTDCLVALQSGTVDAISTDDTILAGLANQDPFTKVIGAKFTDEPYGMAINQNHPEFVRFVNAMLERIRADGTWAAIWTKWLAGVYGSPPAPPPASYRG